MQKLRLWALLVVVLGVVFTMATASLAKKPPPGQDDCKPGWGYGDKNHEHCGPPGQQP